jgi:hypothetical protein
VFEADDFGASNPSGKLRQKEPDLCQRIESRHP